MNGDTLSIVDRPDERELQDLEDQFVRTFHRPPTRQDLLRFRRGRASLALRLPLRTRRTIAALVVSA